jgi:ribonuclease HI
MSFLANSMKLPIEDILKGKQSLHRIETAGSNPPASTSPWTRPPEGMVKLNVDRSFILQDGTASVGIILRRHDGSIILSSCRVLVRCCSALEAELRALVEGVSLASEWCQEPILIETDSAEILQMIRSKERDLSELGNLTSEAKLLLNSDQIGISKIPRAQNFASHE